MKGKLLVGAVIGSVLSANGFAMEITNGKLLNHREWSTGSVKSSVIKEIKKSSRFNLAKFNASMKKSGINTDRSALVSSKNKVENIWTDFATNNTTIASSSEFQFSNFTNSPQTYNITTATCAINLDSGVFNCDSADDSVMLHPGGYADNTSMNFTDMVLDPGNYYAMTAVSISRVGDDVTVYTTYDGREFTIDAAPKK